MNRYLDEKTQESIKSKMLRFDDDLAGKTVAHSIYWDVAGISFTDGTWCAVKGEDTGDDCPEVMHVWGAGDMNLHQLQRLGLESEE